jgi:hypothetical protein
MVSLQANQLIWLGLLLSPVIVLLLLGQRLTFDPNRRAGRRMSVVMMAIGRSDRLWRGLFAWTRLWLLLVLLLNLLELVLTVTGRHDLVAALPAWALFHNDTLATVYLMLTLFVVWMVPRLRAMSASIFDDAFATQFDLGGWRVVQEASLWGVANEHRTTHPQLFPGTWRYRMKWWFKTNLQPVDALLMRMIIDCPSFAEFERRIMSDDYPIAFSTLLTSYPFGRALGTARQLMHHDVLQRVFRANALWELWQGAFNSADGRIISSRNEMAAMLYDELRVLILCPACKGLAQEQASCAHCLGSGAVMTPCPACHGTGITSSKRQCYQCNGTGLENRPIPMTFLNRLQYLWTARNLDTLKATFPVWLSYRAYFVIFAVSFAAFSGIALLLQHGFTVDILSEACLFGSAVLFGVVGAFIAIVFGNAFNGSGALVVPFPLTYSKYGNYLWVEMMGLIGWLTFGLILFDMIFVVSQFLFVPHIDLGFGIVLVSLLTVFLEAISLGVFFSIHAAMRDAKRSQMDELAEWLSLMLQQEYDADTSREEEFYRELRELREWPLDAGIITNILLPIILSIGSLLIGYFIQRQ